MKCIVLAAGYATRLYPLTENFPKPLLKVGDRTILDHLLEDLSGSPEIGEFVIVTNHRFAHCFEQWAKTAGYGSPVTILDDGTLTNETRLGAVMDIRFALDRIGTSEDVLVMAGDNLLDFSLRRFVDYSLEKSTSCIMRYYEPREERLRKCGVVEIDSGDLVLSMQEKPSEPRSNWCCPPFYFYRSEDLRFVEEGIAEGCGTDAPGSFACYLQTKTPVHAMLMPGARYDIGNLESYREVCRNYRGVTL